MLNSRSLFIRKHILNTFLQQELPYKIVQWWSETDFWGMKQLVLDGHTAWGLCCLWKDVSCDCFCWCALHWVTWMSPVTYAHHRYEMGTRGAVRGAIWQERKFCKNLKENQDPKITNILLLLEKRIYNKNNHHHPLFRLLQCYVFCEQSVFSRINERTKFILRLLKCMEF